MVRPAHGCKDSNSKELKYDPRCGMSREEFEWRCHQVERWSQRTPQLLHEMKILTQKMRHHFKDDRKGLKLWNEHEKEILVSFEYYLPAALGSPPNLPVSLPRQQLDMSS